jgi:hypothetical protein
VHHLHYFIVKLFSGKSGNLFKKKHTKAEKIKDSLIKYINFLLIIPSDFTAYDSLIFTLTPTIQMQPLTCCLVDPTEQEL